ncbi:TOR1 [Lepeophtheirus salmonis]|uniref:TOR1 n=1 Tax=Lepeophtheirus salmonis TaxID=72036 RepID=A0A7R8D3T9_LEPSM|nr:TOR1 [Lepeophtheirus salmonis]CAF3020078.1 TOR1 [Lepeophtheirus salmonis]
MCHNNRLQPFNPPILKKDLEDNLFGQHIAQSEILSAVTQLNGGSVSVLIFMGSSGTGKTLATDILCHQFPVPGNIHRFSAPFHFASSSSSHFDTLDDLSHHIPSSCGYSMVIFDDIDNIESDSSEYIASFIASLEINPISRRRSNGTIVVISSRNAGPVIDEYTLNHARSGYERQDITQDKLHLKLKPPVLNIVDVLLKRGIRVSIVPFLPLTRDHVRKCIAREMNLQGISYFPQSEVNNFMEEMSFFASDFPIFSSVGCKKIHHELSVYNNRGDGKTF